MEKYDENAQAITGFGYIRGGGGGGNVLLDRLVSAGAGTHRVSI